MASPRKSTFAFDLSKPVRKGMLLKQGAYHKAFKHRYFVLYPGFLVYFADEARWKFDITRGETLGSRIGAIKLKNGGASIARDAPKGCKYGFSIQAPDKSNKRTTYLLNASCKEERDAWIDAIRHSVPKSPKTKKASPPQSKPQSKHLPKQLKVDEIPPHPSYTARQTTADAAALLGSEEESKEDTQETVTSIDEQLELPQMQVRHDTANTAALIGTAKLSGEEEEDRVISIDDTIASDMPNDEDVNQVLGPTPDPGDESSEEGSERAATPELMQSTKLVESNVDHKGKVEVTCSVTVTVNSDASEEPVIEKVDILENMREEVVRKDSASQNSESGSVDGAAVAESVTAVSAADAFSEHDNDEGVQSKVATFPRQEPGNPLAVIVVNDSDSSSSEDEGVETVPLKTVEEDETAEVEDKKDSSSEEEFVELPAITIDKVTSVKKTDDSESKEERDRKISLNTPQPGQGRRASTPFTEKRGFLYKEGGKRKSWKMRYFVLQPGGFSYYKKDPRSKPLGEVKLKNFQIFFPGVGERKQSFQFTVHTESQWNKRNDWVLAAQSEREMKDWIEAFKLAAGLIVATNGVNGASNGSVPVSVSS